MINIYGKEGCNACKKAVRICTDKGLDYTYKSLGVDYQVSDFMKIKEGHRSFPLVTKIVQYDDVDMEEYVGTYEDLAKLLNN